MSDSSKIGNTRIRMLKSCVLFFLYRQFTCIYNIKTKKEIVKLRKKLRRKSKKKNYFVHFLLCGSLFLRQYTHQAELILFILYDFIIGI